MSSHRLAILSLGILLIVGGGSHASSMSVVADLDSNAADGPDSLAVEVGDTVLVRIWITDSTDSLYGFGLTVGDTSGILSWIEETAVEILVVPEEWSTFSIQQDEQGFLLLQPYDMSFDEPLHLPAEVARLRYVAVDSGACATMAWDSTQSGWQNAEFAEGTFAGFEGIAVYVEGGDDGGSWPGGEDDRGAGEDGDGGGESGEVPRQDGLALYPGPNSTAIPGCLIVQFREGYVEFPQGSEATVFSQMTINDEHLGAVLQNMGVERVRKVMPGVSSSDIRSAINGKIFKMAKLSHTYVLEAETEGTIADLLDSLSACSYSYNYAEACYPIAEFGFPESDSLPDDSLFAERRQAYLEYSHGFGLNMPAAWQRSTGSPSVRLGIYDVGWDLSHPDFEVRDSLGGSVLAHRLQYVNLCDPGASPGGAAHGQWVTGVAAALTQNRKASPGTGYEGMAGVTGGAGGACADSGCGATTIVFDYIACADSSAGPGFYPVIPGYLACIDSCISMGIDVLNMSNGVLPTFWPSALDTAYSVTLAKAFTRAYKAGVVLVAANSNARFPDARLIIPAGLQPNRMMAVNGGTYNGGYSKGLTGKSVDCVAMIEGDSLGSGVFSTAGDSSYTDVGSGTSYAAPQVSAVTALLMSSLKQRYSGRRPFHEEMEALLKAGAEPCEGQIAVRNDSCGHGFVRADRSVSFTREPWHWERKLATGRDSLVPGEQPETVFVWTDDSGDSLMPEGRYIGIPYEAFLTIADPHLGGNSIPIVAGIGEGDGSSPGGRTQGWANPLRNNSILAIYQDYFCEVETVTTTTITLKTHLWKFTHEWVDGGWDADTFWMPIDSSASQHWYYGLFYELDSASAVSAIPYTELESHGEAGRLLSVVPTPSNPSATIRYWLPFEADVVLEIVDVRGRINRVLRTGEDSEGYHAWTWDGLDDRGRAVPAGVYFARLVLDSHQLATERIVLLR